MNQIKVYDEDAQLVQTLVYQDRKQAIKFIEKLTQKPNAKIIKDLDEFRNEVEEPIAIIEENNQWHFYFIIDMDAEKKLPIDIYFLSKEDYTDLEYQAEELIQFGGTKEKAIGHGINRVLEKLTFIDDYDFFNSESDYCIGDIKIDSIGQLRNFLKNSGLQSIASYLEIDTNLITGIVINEIKISKVVKQLFGDKRFFHYDLTQEEKKAIEEQMNEGGQK